MIAAERLCQGPGGRLEGINLVLKNRRRQLGEAACILQSLFIHVLKLFGIKQARLIEVAN